MKSAIFFLFEVTDTQFASANNATVSGSLMLLKCLKCSQCSHCSGAGHESEDPRRNGPQRRPGVGGLSGAHRFLGDLHAKQCWR